MIKKLVVFLTLATVFLSCAEDQDDNGYIPTSQALITPALFDQLLPAPIIPEDNPQTEEGVALGKKLFYDTQLSADNTLSCAGCHAPSTGFSDARQFSIGIDGIAGFRNSMPLFNLAYNFDEQFNWDGSALTLEEQILGPVVNEIEMHNTWPNATQTLQQDPTYPEMFGQAFGTDVISKELVTKAIAQFLRTIITGNSRFDQFLAGEVTLTDSETNGLSIFLDEAKGDCFHCHGNQSSPLWTDNIFHNNGLDESFTDRGRGEFTGDPNQFGQFRSPSLRNLAYTAPYMHDGRFETLDQVIDHYSEGLVFSDTIDPLMKSVAEGGVMLTPEEKADLKAFLLSLSDPSLLTNPAYLPSNTP